MSKLTRKVHHAPYPTISPTRPELSTAGKTVCTTGGGTGIRFACTEAFAQSGAKNIITTSRRAKILYGAEQKLSSKYPKSKFYALTTNVSKASDVEAIFKKVANGIGPTDIFIANAGYAPTAKKIKNMDISDFMCAVEVNLIGTYLCAMHFAKQASRRNDPVFINMSTGHAHAPPQLPISGYGVSKVAAAKAIDYLAYENPGIGVYQIHPGAIRKNMTADYPSKEMLREDIALPGALCVWLASSEVPSFEAGFYGLPGMLTNWWRGRKTLTRIRRWHGLDQSFLVVGCKTQISLPNETGGLNLLNLST